MESSIDMEKVIKGLEHCANEADCRGCVYQEQMKGRSDECDCTGEALALLKEQEPVSPIDENYWIHTLGRCGHCKAPLPAIEGLRPKFCWMCGRAVKWE
jgi:hypothetical protein